MFPHTLHIFLQSFWLRPYALHPTAWTSPYSSQLFQISTREKVHVKASIWQHFTTKVVKGWWRIVRTVWVADADTVIKVRDVYCCRRKSRVLVTELSSIKNPTLASPKSLSRVITGYVAYKRQLRIRREMIKANSWRKKTEFYRKIISTENRSLDQVSTLHKDPKLEPLIEPKMCLE